jgi:hypothetical protein
VDEKFKTERIQFEKKQAKKEEKIIQFEQLRLIAFNEKKNYVLKKNQEIQKVLVNKKIKSRKKISGLKQKR